MRFSMVDVPHTSQTKSRCQPKESKKLDTRRQPFSATAPGPRPAPILIDRHRLRSYSQGTEIIDHFRRRDLTMLTSRSKITHWLECAPAGAMNGYAVAAAFMAYFCVYAFRKPFTAATYEGLQFAGTDIQLKTAFVVSQILGYTVSKYLGIKLVSESSPQSTALDARRPDRIRRVCTAAVRRPAARMESRRDLSEWPATRYGLGAGSSDISKAAARRISCSPALPARSSSRVACSKTSAARCLPATSSISSASRFPNPLPPLTEFWMPAATGLLFLPAFLLCALAAQPSFPNPRRKTSPPAPNASR